MQTISFCLKWNKVIHEEMRVTILFLNDLHNEVCRIWDSHWMNYIYLLHFTSNYTLYNYYVTNKETLNLYHVCFAKSLPLYLNSVSQYKHITALCMQQTLLRSNLLISTLARGNCLCLINISGGALWKNKWNLLNAPRLRHHKCAPIQIQSVRFLSSN